ncbi:MAG: hypothetical protein KDA57_12445 [Planctomycetales bacterium]|nr:hypothetical protein [Planctomycetales bacterium]
MSAPLTQRLQSVMHLLLIWALLLCWIASVNPPNVHRTVLDLERSLVGFSQALQLQSKQTGESKLRELKSRFSAQSHQSSLLRYSSLSVSSPENRQATAAEYLAATDAALELGDQLARHPLLKANIAASQELANSKRNLLSLQWYADRAELGPAATLADVARESRPKITIPGTQHALPMATALVASIPGLTFVYLYLVSLIGTLRESAQRAGHAFHCDWVLLHSGWLGPVLGLLWLSAPMIALVGAGRAVFSSQAVNSVSQAAVYAAPLLPIAWVWCCISALRLRRALGEHNGQEDGRDDLLESVIKPRVSRSRAA